MSKVALSVALVATLALIRCGNPAEDKPEAKVGEATQAHGPGDGHDHSDGTEGQKLVFAEESTIQFVGSKVTGKHDGGFKSFHGTFNLVDNDPTKSSVDVQIDATSIWADNERLTGHLKSEDFFDVATYPKARFTSTSITRGENGYTITGNLHMHGVTKSISFPATINVMPDKVTAEAEFFIKRFDWDIAFKGKADDLIRDEVVIKLDMVAVPESKSAS